MDFKLRPWTLNDLDSLVKYADNWNIAKFLTDAFPHPYTNESGKFYIDLVSKNEPQTIFAIDVNGEAVGSIGIYLQSDVHKKNAELGYWLAEPFWGKGLVTQAVKKIVEYSFQTFEIERIFARPFGTNLASQNVLEKAGFKLEAHFEKTIFKNGEYLDELVYAIRKT